MRVPILYAMSESTIAFRECNKCKQPLRIVQVTNANGLAREVAYNRDSTHPHVCWNLAEDANLLVLDD